MNNTATPDGDEPVNRPVALEDEADLEAFVDEHPVVLVEFYTNGCGLCASMEPVITGIAKSTDVAVGTINPRDDPPLIGRFDVRSVPHFVLFGNGDVIARRADGFIPGDELREWLEANR